MGKGKRAKPMRLRKKWWPAVAVMAAGGAVAGLYASGSSNPPPPDDEESEATPAPSHSDTGTLPASAFKASPKPSASHTAKPKPKPKPSRVKPKATKKPKKAAPKATHKPAPVHHSSTGIDAMIAFLKAQVGKSYVWGGNGPNAYDCSGLTKAAYERVGVRLPRTSELQSLEGTRVGLNELRPGDLLFWGPPGLASHVAVYIGGGHYIAAENPRAGVVNYSISYYRPDYGRRIL